MPPLIKGQKRNLGALSDTQRLEVEGLNRRYKRKHDPAWLELEKQHRKLRKLPKRPPKYPVPDWAPPIVKGTKRNLKGLTKEQKNALYLQRLRENYHAKRAKNAAERSEWHLDCLVYGQ